MDSKKSITVFMIVCLLIGAAVVITNQGVAQARSLAEAEGISVPFSWSLTDATGRSAKDGVYTFTFKLYDAQEGGNLLWSEQQSDVKVKGGKVNLDLGVVTPIPESLAEKIEARYWLEVKVRNATEKSFTTLSPRQAVTLFPQSPQALSCPHSHFTDNWIGSNSAFGLRVENTGTGNAIRGVTNSTTNNTAAIGGYNIGSGSGVYGSSAGYGGFFEGGSYGVVGSSDGGLGGVYGLSGESGMGVYGESYDNYGVKGKSTSSFGVMAEGVDQSAIPYYTTAGDILLGGSRGDIFATGIDGMFLHSNKSIRLFLDKDNNDDSDFHIFNGQGNDIFMIEEDGDLYTAGSKAGYVVDVAQNDDSVPMALGDVVAISGVGEPILGEIPLIKVQLADTQGTNAVLGVVDKCYVSPTEDKTGITSNPASESCADADSIAPGEYMTVVTLGSFKAIKVDASFGAIQPGDLLVASSNPGYAMVDNDAKAGTIIGKALEGLASGTGTIAVLISFQ